MGQKTYSSLLNFDDKKIPLPEWYLEEYNRAKKELNTDFTIESFESEYPLGFAYAFC